MKTWYKALSDSFPRFPKEVQVLHLVSELKKAAAWYETHPETGRNHSYRALILLDFLIGDPRWREALSALCRLREAVAALIPENVAPYATPDQRV